MNAKRKQILEKLRTLLEPWIDSGQTDHVSERTNLLADIGIDSVGILQLVLGVEDEFGITIKDHELESDVFSQMGNFIDIIESRINENN
ncbi:MAG: hypothetical protein H8D47_05445 [Planctomycetes bacterium]|nr:hypothetical protein [Planctomycetota bacterium]